MSNKGMDLNSARYAGAGLILAAMMPLSHGLRLYNAQSSFMQESSQRNAIVIDQIARSSERRDTVNSEVFSVVEFIDDNGTRRTASTNIASYPAPHAVGEEIKVRTHHTQPDDVRVASFTGLWLESAFYLVPGFLTLAIGTFLFLRKRQPTRK